MKFFIILLFLTGCNFSHTPTHFKGIAMTIPYSIQIGDGISSVQQLAIEKIIVSTFAEIHKIHNNWNPKSEISVLNKALAYQTILLSPQLALFLKEVDNLVKLTEGRFDPTVAPLQTLWKEKLSLNMIPTEEDIAKITPAVGWNHVHIEGNMFYKDHDLTALDLGGVAKGYAVDLLVERLQKEGFHHIYVEWGGEIRTVGHHPEGRKWRVALLGLDSLNLNNQAIATSGNYFQKWSIDAKVYTHLTNPQTKQPLIVKKNSISSVHVVSPTCAQADALATALMLFNSNEEAEKWARKNRIWVRIQN